MSEIIILSSDDEGIIEEIPKEDIPSTNRKTLKEPLLTVKADVDNDAFFKGFLDFCAETEVDKRGGSARSMNIIKEKLLARYNAADSEYIHSKEFEEVVSLAKQKVVDDPTNLFVHMKQVVDELKIRRAKKKDEANKRKCTEGEIETQSKRRKEETVDSEEEREEEININKRHVEKLERLFHKVYRKVKKLGEKEVDWDDDEDSSYMKWHRYEKRLYLIWEKWQEARGRLDEVKRLKSRRIAFAGTEYFDLNKKIENFVNKTQKFPDFHDILKLTKETLDKDEDKPMSHDKLRIIATAAFRSIGEHLQKRRVYDFWNSFLTYLPSEKEDTASLIDPAENDATLSRVLKENQKQNEKRMDEVFNQFVDQQISQKLEAEEVPPSVEDEGSVSEGDENKEEDVDEEEQEEDPEDIIAISSSSEESDAEAGENAEENGIQDPDHYENGDAGETNELKMEGINKVNEKNKSSVKDKSESSSTDCLSDVKSEPKSQYIDPLPSCSFSNRDRKERIKNSIHCDVLSESD